MQVCSLNRLVFKRHIQQSYRHGLIRIYDFPSTIYVAHVCLGLHSILEPINLSVFNKDVDDSDLSVFYKEVDVSDLSVFYKEVDVSDLSVYYKEVDVSDLSVYYKEVDVSGIISRGYLLNITYI